MAPPTLVLWSPPASACDAERAAVLFSGDDVSTIWPTRSFTRIVLFRFERDPPRGRRTHAPLLGCRAFHLSAFSLCEICAQVLCGIQRLTKRMPGTASVSFSFFNKLAFHRWHLVGSNLTLGRWIGCPVPEIWQSWVDSCPERRDRLTPDECMHSEGPHFLFCAPPQHVRGNL